LDWRKCIFKVSGLSKSLHDLYSRLMILASSDYTKICCCCQNRLMIRNIASWFWQHQTVQRFAVVVRIASWFMKSLHDFDSIRLCRNQLIFQNHLTSSSYKNPSFFPKIFTTQSYNQKQKFIKLISTQQHQHFTLIYQESQFTTNDPFSSKLLKQQLNKMEHPWHKSTTTSHNNNNIIKPWIHHNSTTQYHNSSIWA